MSSLVLNPSRYNAYIESGAGFERFKFKFLVEGDSWMDRSAILAPSLPEYLREEFDDHGVNALLFNIARFGDVMTNIGHHKNEELRFWLSPGLHFDAILFSAGGNDYIDAALGSAGQPQILKRFTAAELAPTRARDCLSQAGLTRLRKQLDASFAVFLNTVRSQPHHERTPIFLHNYSVLTARNAPVRTGGNSWLHRAFREHGIPPAFDQEITAIVFKHLQDTLKQYAKPDDHVHLVATDGLLIPAEPHSTGSNQDWENEIHPNKRGWRKLASAWYDTVSAVMGS
jgi:hypothetical protein